MFIDVGARRAACCRQPRTATGAGNARGRPTAAGGIGFCLPRLAPDVPRALQLPDANAANIGLAQFLLEAGAVRERDVPRAWCDPLQVCEGAMQRWLDEQLGTLRCLSPWFSMALFWQGGDDAPGGAGGVQIRWGESAVLRWDVGGGLEWLERQQPGLGGAVLATIDACAGGLYPLFTPRTALDAASFLYWQGEEDEGLVLGEMCDTPEEREAMRADMVTRALLADAFPAWALEPPSLPDAHSLLLRSRAGTGLPPAMRRAVELAAELARLPARREFAPDVEGLFIGFGAVLCWRPDDLAMRISDDLAHYAWQDSYVDYAGETTFPLCDPAAMRSWRRQIRPVLRAIALFDALIWLLTEGYCLHQEGTSNERTIPY